MYKSFNKKPLTKKGVIKEIKVSDIIKNYLVGMNDYYNHTLTIEDNDGKETKFIMRLTSEEPKMPTGTLVTFRYIKDKDLDFPRIEVKSFSKTYTPFEIAKINGFSDKMVLENPVIKRNNEKNRSIKLQ